jgi:hypothetical protein
LANSPQHHLRALYKELRSQAVVPTRRNNDGIHWNQSVPTSRNRDRHKRNGPLLLPEIHRSKQEKILFIVAYRVCKEAITTAGEGTSFFHQGTNSPNLDISTQTHEGKY